MKFLAKCGNIKFLSKLRYKGKVIFLKPLPILPTNQENVSQLQRRSLIYTEISHLLALLIQFEV